MMDAWDHRFIPEDDARFMRIAAVAGILLYAIGTGLLALLIGLLMRLLG